MRIALAQIAATTEPEQNLALIADGVADAAGRGAELVVFPEATQCRFGVPLGGIAEPLDGPWATRVREIAGRAGVTVVAGMFTPADDGRVRNTLLATGGGVEAHYDKIHLFDAFGFAESDTVAPGTDPVTITVGGATVGLATCYDLRFAGLFQKLGDAGAELVVVPASWGAGPGKQEQWDLLVRARALDSTAFVAACDQADPASVGHDVPAGVPTGIGASLVSGPTGTALDSLGAGPGLLVTDVDLSEVGPVRRAVPVLVNRRY
ncbi:MULTISPECIES: carbon-nitrogen hydrolase family protein [unclassified Pseudonocardia]|uniref:carbon-nitrogen hydrolase family protein n=1 Tax=unclassified Pseudonocardia TaxID=2619320 RepID=UPI0001FFDA3D|nr:MULTISPECIES: carbon-nitrogen hydrolase family protein [unclassified Pseudonocardia]ALE74427.1 hydrolase [Pseudonocardia sp. EC080625-04]ALL77847.1 hydrolase [Pseudonocardia sp. EC080610-09]ALL80762.1 hydrolase [Pseudonocardia sp. EC080619-01]OLM17284.1 Aliphatic amidase AmiE [Pseudonocardia sp. Ae707_Ps1]